MTSSMAQLGKKIHFLPLGCHMATHKQSIKKLFA
jgi:hypothetical protein